jgi:predicted nuclease of predicted toxin-antitoxin system
MHSLKFLLDADMPRSSAKVLQSIGFEVEDVRDIGMRAAKDREIIEYALKNKRIIVTKDTDFGEVLRYPDHPGAIIFRLPYAFTSKELNERLVEFFKSVKKDEIQDAITIVELSRYRRRTLKNEL